MGRLSITNQWVHIAGVIVLVGVYRMQSIIKQIHHMGISGIRKQAGIHQINKGNWMKALGGKMSLD